MPTKSNELFLLTTELCELTSKDSIIKFYVDRINSIFPSINITWTDLPNEKGKYEFQVATKNQIYGYLFYDLPENLDIENLENLKKSTLHLAFLLEKIEQEASLKKLNEKTNDYHHINTETVLSSPQQKLIEQNTLLQKAIKRIEENEKQLLLKNQDYETLNEELAASNEELLASSDALKTLNSELEETKETVEASEAKFRGYIEYSPIGIIIVDQKGKYLEVNPAACKITGHSKEKLLTISISDLLPEEGLEEGFKHFERVKKNGFATGENKFVHASGKIRYWTVEAVKLTETRFMGFVYDITERKNAEFSLKEKQHELQRKNTEYEVLNEELVQINEELLLAKENAEIYAEKLREAQKLAKIGNWELNLVENSLFWSDEIYRIFGSEPREFDATYEAFLNFIHPDDRDFVNNAYNKHLKTKTPYNIIHRIVGKNNDIKYVNEKCVSEFDETGKAIKSIGTVADITETILIQNELKKAKERAEESDHLKNEFINNMSHEIRTPMNGILGFADLLNKPGLASAKRRQYINIIRNSGKQLLRVIDDILEISKLGTKQVQSIEDELCLNDLMLELFSIFDIKAKENKTPLYLHKGLSDKESKIISDSSKLNKILSNLIENALKFTNEGFVEFGYTLSDTNLNIYVKDTGVGISKEKQESIFERFSQEEKDISRNIGGLGLGLSIAKENTELLGGNIKVISDKHKGSKFVVTIPYKPVHSELKQDLSAERQLKKTTVLIVEDEEVNYLFIEALLEEELKDNYEILHAKNGVEAIKQAELNEHIDLIFMDIKLPVMDGNEATKRIRKFRPNTPIIAQTAYSSFKDQDVALFSGCNDFIVKPINQENFRNILLKYLHLGIVKE